MLTRRLLAFAMLAVLAGCAPQREPPVFERLDFDYLTKLQLDVARIDIDDSWVPRGGARQVGFLAPTRPEAALRAMAESRLFPGGTQGRGLFVIDDASIVQRGDQYVGTLAVHLDLFDAADQRTAHVEARVRATRPVTDDEDAVAVRIDLDAMMRKMMSDMNVEFEFQLRQALRDRVRSSVDPPRAPAAVEQQDLNLPPGARAAPAPPAEAAPGPTPLAPAPPSPPPAQLSPPPGLLDAPRPATALPPLGPPVVVTTPP